MRRTAKFAGTVIVAALVAALVSVGVVFADQTPKFAWYANDPAASEFTVSTPSDLRGLSALVNGTADLDGDGTFEPAVDFAGKTVRQGMFPISLANKEFTPIGTEEHPFMGTFLGGAAVGNAPGLDDIRCVRVSSGSAYRGLFGYCGEGSLIEGVRISSVGTASVIDIPTPISASHLAPEGQLDADAGITSADVEPDTVVHDVGSLVGYTAGSVRDCTSAANVMVTSTLQATASDPLVICGVGGLAGTCVGDMSDCSYTGDITVTAPSLASDSSDAVVANIGGVVGTLGAVGADARTARVGTMSSCTFGKADDSGSFGIGKTQSLLHVVCMGVGGLDRFGIQKEATSASVGGIAGYSYGGLAACSNYGLVNTNCADALLYKDSLGHVRLVGASDGEELPPRQYPQAESLFKMANGGSGVGGIVGTLRDSGYGLSGYQRADIGSPEAPIGIDRCFNSGMVVGLARTGGIAGNVGSYANIDSSRNGKPDAASGTGVYDDSGHVVSTRWNKPMTGGIAGTTSGDISNCANLAEVENIQTGYYTAGIVGGLHSPASRTSEVYACFNTGQVHVTSHATQAYREAGLVGNNGGYLHDCVMRSGCVLSHDDGDATYPNAAIGDDSWGMWSNVKFYTASELKKSDAAAVLNAGHAADVLNLSEDQWTYWYIRAGYPTLSIWEAPADRAQLTSANVRASCAVLAEYAGNVEAIPTLIVTYTGAEGAVKLVQNVDFYALPQKGATHMTGDDANTMPYKASIVGIGNYEGTVLDVCSYGIGPCDLKNCEVATSAGKYNFGACVYPAAITVRNPSGAEIDPAEYRYQVYGSATYTLTGASTANYVVFDSAGFVQWADGGGRVPVSQPAAASRLVSDLTGVDYTLYDADGARIYEVTDGGTKRHTYDPVSGNAVSSGGPILYKAARSGVKDGGLAGYIVKVTAADGARTLKERSWTSGQYVIEAIDLYRDAVIEQVALSVPNDDGTATEQLTWYWNSEKSMLYLRDAASEPVVDEDGALVGASVKFTGSEIKPTMTVSYTKENGERIVLPIDERSTRACSLIYGDPYTSNQDLTYFNRDATPLSDEAAKVDEALAKLLKDHEKAAVTVRSHAGVAFSNYVHCYFDITPAALDECALAVGGEDVSAHVKAASAAPAEKPYVAGEIATFAYRGGYGVRPTVELTRCGNTLKEGLDFEVEYANNVNVTDEQLAADYALLRQEALASGSQEAAAALDAFVQAHAAQFGRYTVTGLGNVVGSYTGYFMIGAGNSLAAAGYVVDGIAPQQYNFGYEIRPAEGVHLAKWDKSANGGAGAFVRDESMVEGRDFTVEYEEDSVYVTGSFEETLGVKVYVRGVNRYTGLLYSRFEVVPFDFCSPDNAWRLGEWTLSSGLNTKVHGGIPALSAYGCYTRKVYPIVDWSAYDPATGGGISQDVALPGNGPRCFRNVETGEVYKQSASLSWTSKFPPPGTYRAEIDHDEWDRGAGHYTGYETIPEPIELVKYNIAGYLTATVDRFRCDAVTYDGAAHEPITDLEDGWRVIYRDNVNAGTARFTVSVPDTDEYFTGVYEGAFEINPIDLSDAQVKVCDQLYAKRALTPAVTVSVGDLRLVEGRDYDLAYANNVNKGVATVVVRGKGNCTGKAEATFKIGAVLNLAQAEVAPILDQLFAGEGVAVCPKPTVTYDGEVLQEGVDYTLTYEGNDAVTADDKPAVVKVTGLSNRFKGSSTSATFRIVEKLNITDATCEIADQAYTGEPVCPEIRASYGDRVLEEGVDYSVDYRRNLKAGADARAVLSGLGDFEGVLSVPFNIVVKAGASEGSGQLAVGIVERFGAEAADATASGDAFSCKVAGELYPGSVESAVIAWSGDYAGQLMAQALAHVRSAPVLLCKRASLTAEAETFLREHGVTSACVVGGSPGGEVEERLVELGITVNRIAAGSTAATSAAVADEMARADDAGARDSAPARIAVAALANPADLEGAAVLSAWACAQGAPILFTKADGTLPDEVSSCIASCARLVIAGGYTQVDAAVEDALPANAEVVRLSGANSYEECASIVRFELHEGMAADGALVASARSLPMQLAASGLAGARNVAFALIADGQLQTVGELSGALAPAYKVVAVGGEESVSDTMAHEIATEMGWS